MPANTYGWSPLKAVTDQRWRLIAAPRPELYDLRADPGEERNLIAEQRREASRLKQALKAIERSQESRRTASPEPDPELAADLRSLGYLSSSSSRAGEIDPKDGRDMLTELAEAKQLLLAGESVRAASILRHLVRRSPGNIPFLTQLGAAELAAGDADAALAAYRRAVSLNPQLDFLHLNLGRAYLELGRAEEARRELEVTLEINRRAAEAWLGLGELAHRAGESAEERRLLLEAVAAGTASALIRTRLGQIEMAGGDLAAADSHLRIAAGLVPDLAFTWLLWGDLAEARRRPTEALLRYRKAAAIEPASAVILLRLGRLELRTGAAAEGRRHLERAAALAPGSPEGREARRLLQGL
jgi:predicted Zn-dependent protease